MVCSRVFRPVQAIVAVLAVVLVMSCSSGPRPTVRSEAGYEVIQIGSVNYTTPAGWLVVEQGKGYVVHEVAGMPGTRVRVQVESDPPRSLRIDADAAKRRFLQEVPNARLTSAQYHEYQQRQNVKVLVRGMNREGAALFGSMNLVREDKETAVVKVVGPADQRTEIIRLAEELGRSLQL